MSGRSGAEIMAALKAPEGLSTLRSLDFEESNRLASEIREFLIASVSKSGGHLGPNLGVVELTIAIHRIFDSPKDTVLFDTGHQAYVHKILTGRADGFDFLRQRGGVSGYPSRSESPHDVIENSHASTALSWADGIAKAHKVRGVSDRHVVAVVGDGSLTGGMAWEALNNIASSSDLPLVIVVNDNERSYAPTVGGVATYLSTLRATQGYERFLDWGKHVLSRTPVVGNPIYETLHGLKKGLKDIVAPQGMFEDLGLKYLGPVDGHDIAAVEQALVLAKNFGRPVLVHVITEKGRGHLPAINDELEKFHAVGVVDPETGVALKSAPLSWTSVFADELVKIGHERPDVVALTAAMLGPTGLDKFQAQFPRRTFDVGIAEQHAATSAAGMAFAGLHPVVAVYSTFLNRAFDQLIMDVALHNAGVTFVLDRAGVTGDDGASHNGIWDMALTGIVPRLSVSAPRDAQTLREELREAIAISDAPTLLRFSKGAVPADLPAIERVGGVDILHRSASRDALLVAIGAFAHTGVAAAKEASEIGITVVDPRWVKPIPEQMLSMVSDYRVVYVLEDGVVTGGIGASLRTELAARGVNTPVYSLAVPGAFFEHGKRAEILAEIALDTVGVLKQLRHWWKVTEDSPLPWDGISGQSQPR